LAETFWQAVQRTCGKIDLLVYTHCHDTVGADLQGMFLGLFHKS
jgi:hypothetical protein